MCTHRGAVHVCVMSFVTVKILLICDKLRMTRIGGRKGRNFFIAPQITPDHAMSKKEFKNIAIIQHTNPSDGILRSFTP